MTKEALLNRVQKLFDDAYAVDEERALRICVTVFDRPVWCWSNLSVLQLRVVRPILSRVLRDSRQLPVNQKKPNASCFREPRILNHRNVRWD